MTLWPAARIADFASSAGWRGERLVEATALALTVSGGDDHWEWVSSTTGAVVAIGLWGLAPAFVPGYELDELADPRVNARAAYATWKAAGESFRWSKSYGTAAYDANVGTAREVSSRLGRSTVAAPPAPIGDAPGLAKAVAQGGRRAVGFLQDAAGALRRLG